MSPLIMKTCEMFAKAGFDVELWIPNRGNEYEKILGTKDPFEYHKTERNFVIKRLTVLDLMVTFPGKLPFYLLILSFNLSLFFRTLFYSQRNDIFYFHDIRDAFSPILLRRPTFLEIHDFYQPSSKFISRLFGRVKGFIVTNKIKMKILAEERGIPKERLLHQPNGVDIGMFTPGISKDEAKRILGLPVDKKIILYTGHLFNWKGVDTLIETARITGYGFAFYFIGGANSDIRKFKAKTEQDKNVVIAGRKLHQEVPVWQVAADVLVLPNSGKFLESTKETSPVKLFEYMASGTPIVASDLPSIRNIVDEDMVWFFTPDDPQSLRETISNVLDQKNEAERKSKRAFDEVKKYSWDERTKAISGFIRGIVRETA